MDRKEDGKGRGYRDMLSYTHRERERERERKKERKKNEQQ
jgi:hypothetical protein